MAVYTTTIRAICENAAGLTESEGLTQVDNIILAATHYIFDFEYTIPARFKPEFEKRFLLHFYMREIGLETVGLFKLKLRDKMCCVQDYYKIMLERQANDFDFFRKSQTETTDNYIDNTHGENGTHNSKKTFTPDTVMKKYYIGVERDIDEHKDVKPELKRTESDSPQGQLSNIFNNDSYVSYAVHENQQITEYNVTRIKRFDDVNGLNQRYDKIEYDEGSKDTTEVNEGQKSWGDYHTHDAGSKTTTEYDKTPAEIFIEYRETILNIIQQLINEFEPLFMQIF